MKHLLVIMVFVSAFAGNANAQNSVSTTATEDTLRLTEKILTAAGSTKIVKGAPFSAEGISESVKVLSDGNKITNSTTTKMYRDSEGRFRREGSSSQDVGGAAALYGSLASSYSFENPISIFDPVEGIRYLLTPSTKSARRFPNPSSVNAGVVSLTNKPADKTQTENLGAGKVNFVIKENAGSLIKPESLGTKMIKGIEVEGTRTVTTIAAGAIGNEKPIEIVNERWYSKELDLIIYSRFYDPRYGEQTYRLKNINRSEPDRSLFTIPSDYKIIAEKPFNLYITKPE